MGKDITFRGITKNLEFYKNLAWNKPLTPEMEQYELETKKKAIYRGVITGSFEYWMYWEDKTKIRKKRKNKTVTQQKQEVTIIKFTPKQLKKIAVNHWEEFNIITARQLLRLFKKMDLHMDKPITNTYKMEILKIFDLYNIKYNKKYICVYII